MSFSCKADNLDEDVEKREPSCTVGELEQPGWKTVWNIKNRVLKYGVLKIEMPYNLVTLLLGIQQK